MESCTGFCSGPVNTRAGLESAPSPKLNGKDSVDIYKGSTMCPIGYKHNPKTRDKTRNLIKAGGRFQICPRNPWKWEA